MVWGNSSPSQEYRRGPAVVQHRRRLWSVLERRIVDIGQHVAARTHARFCAGVLADAWRAFGTHLGRDEVGDLIPEQLGEVGPGKRGVAGRGQSPCLSDGWVMRTREYGKQDPTLVTTHGHKHGRPQPVLPLLQLSMQVMPRTCPLSAITRGRVCADSLMLLSSSSLDAHTKKRGGKKGGGKKQQH